MLRYFGMHFMTGMMVLLLVTACNSPTGARSNSAWSSYDYRHPVPASSNLPSAAYYPHYDSGGYYQDNDQHYTPPSSFGCSPDNIHMCE